MLSSIAEHFDLPANRLYAERDRLLKNRRKIIDLVSGNVNSQGILFPQPLLQRALADGMQKAKVYKPDPLGQLEARQAISRYYAGEKLSIPPEQIALTPGTSVSYWYAFKLLADSGDEILAPTPSYPLFDSIAALCGIKLVHYRLKEAVRWEIDFEHLESAISPRTKAIILISPHNPTGAVATEGEVERLADIAGRHGLAIIADEVFSAFVYPLSSNDNGRLPRPAKTNAPLVLTLNGLSKMLALPGLKIGWMAVTGDPSLVKKTIKALDLISDTFLPVNEMAQFAVPTLLEKSGSFRASYSSEIGRRMRLATTFLKESQVISFIQPEGGFFLVLRLDRTLLEEEDVALRLIQKHTVLVHPGYFYDMTGRHLVLSFATKPALLRNALQRMTDEFESL